jgi:biofilm PGA synthesis N-glycosyltransferase PgaC
VTATGSLPAYAVITPVRDEAEHFAVTAASMAAQAHPPARWVVVDDGSTDGTRAIADRFAATHDWVTVVSGPGSHERARGAPIVRAFQLGCELVEEPVEVLVKMDGDLFLPAHYFAWVAATFARDPRAGIVGGVPLVHDGTRWREEGTGRPSVDGTTKAYRRACLDDIGGLRPSMGWDGIDDYGARARGWNVHELTELNSLHYKRRGSRQRWWRARWEEGLGNHYMGYRWQWLALRAGYRMMVESPVLLGGLTLGAGYAYGHLRRRPQVDDSAARAALREAQRRRLSGLLSRRPAPSRHPLPDGGPAFWFAASPPADREHRP